MSDTYMDIVRLNENQEWQLQMVFKDHCQENADYTFWSHNPPAFLTHLKTILCNSELKSMTYQLHTAVVTLTRTDRTSIPDEIQGQIEQHAELAKFKVAKPEPTRADWESNSYHIGIERGLQVALSIINGTFPDNGD